MAKHRPKSAADWDKRYVDNHLPWDNGKPDVHLRRFIKASKIDPCKALEVGCGTGTNAICLATHGLEVVGLDLSPVAIKRAEVKAGKANANCQFLAADFMKASVPSSPFGLIFCSGLLSCL